MDPLEAGAVHQAMPQGVIQHGARTVERVQRGTDKPRTNDQRKAHMRLGEAILATWGIQARGGYDLRTRLSHILLGDLETLWLKKNNATTSLLKKLLKFFMSPQSDQSS